jgi:hypothetical protein
MANGDDVPSLPDATPAPAEPAPAKPRKKYTIRDKATGDSVKIWGPVDNPDLDRLRSMAHDVFERRKQFNPLDMFKSIPFGAVQSLSTQLSAAGRAEMLQMGEDPSSIPGPEQTTDILSSATGIPLHKPEGRGGRVGERIGEFLFDPMSWIGPGGPVRKLLTATLGGIGSAEGERLGQRYGRPELGAAIGGVTGGAAGGFGSGARGLPGRVPKDIREATSDEALKAASKAGYQQLDQFQYRLAEGQAAVLTRATKNYLESAENTTFPEMLAPKTYQALDTYMLKARTVADVERTRQVLNQIRVDGGNDALAASKAIEAIDDYMYELPGVGAVSRQARGDWAAYKRGQMVEETIRRGVERATVSGKGGAGNIVNTIKQEFKRRIRDKPEVWKRFTPAEQDQIELIIDPGRGIDVAHWMSNFSPRHPITGAIGFFGSGNVTGDPLTQLGVLATGEIAHRFTKRMTQGRAERLLETTRARSPAGTAAAGLPEGATYTPRPAVPALQRAGYGALRAAGSSVVTPGVSDALELPEIVVTPQ